MNLSTLERKQRQLIVHSFIYYHKNDNIWSDGQWDKTAKEIIPILNTPIAKKSKFYEVFKDFDGCTGYNLANYKWVDNSDHLNTQSYEHHFHWLAEYLLKMHEKT